MSVHDAENYLAEFDALEGKSVDTDPDPSPKPGAARLRRYWVHGPGAAKIGWGAPGDFKRCVSHLSKYVGPENAKGLCNVYHVSATGSPPGKGHKSLKILFDRSALEFTANMLEAESRKGDEMEIEHKSVAGMVTAVDKKQGIVETIVSVTGILDGVNDIIQPGAYTKTLKTRNPKGVQSHSWETPTGKTLDVKELMPGDSMLPKKMPDGSPWPKEAGALWVKTQFNLDTQRGREAFSDVVFYGDEQEWSIGYRVPPGGSKTDTKTGARLIDTLDLYEYSTVLFGAMSAARTLSAKDALAEEENAEVEVKTVIMTQEEFMEFKNLVGPDRVVEVKSEDDSDESETDGDDTGKDTESKEDAAANEDDEPEDVEGKASAAAVKEREDTDSDTSTTEGDTAASTDAEGDAEGADTGGEEDAEAEGAETSDSEEDEADGPGNQLMQVVSDAYNDLGDFGDRMVELADEYDLALNAEDQDSLNDVIEEMLDIIEDSGDVEPTILDAFQKVADGIAQITSSIESDAEVNDETAAETDDGGETAPEGDEAAMESESTETDTTDEGGFKATIDRDAAPLSNAKSMTMAQYIEHKALLEI